MFNIFFYGARFATYLNNLEGGETIFPKINKLVKPEKGKFVIFQNVDNNGDIITHYLHGGEPVKNGLNNNYCDSNFINIPML